MEYTVLDTPEAILAILPLLLEQKIYQFKTWRMYEWYTSRQSDIKKVSYCKIKEKIVGAALYLDSPSDDVNVSVYVRQEYRRKGIGTKLVKNLAVSNLLCYDTGYRKEFWNNVKR